MKSSLGKYVVMILAVLLGFLGYCVFDYIDTNIYNGVYPIGKFICIVAGFIPFMVADIVKSKKITSVIFPIIILGAVVAWFALTLPEITYSQGEENLNKDYTNVVVSTKAFDNQTTVKDKIPAFYKGAYIYEGTKDGVEYFLVMNPENGKIYEYEIDKYSSMAEYFGNN